MSGQETAQKAAAKKKNAIQQEYKQENTRECVADSKNGTSLVSAGMYFFSFALSPALTVIVFRFFT
jgi:hypothetical protein